ncbi:MAG: CoA ester lyase, partial [Fimbriimonadaceae bacterium]|nr:CoA ester lyase [Fimbriimonadaceae bacterium]
AVAPQDKDQALILVRRTLAAVDFGDSQRWVRLNADRALDEAAQLLGLADAFILPKSEDPEAVAEFAFAVAPTPVTALLETALGVVRAFDIATCAPNVSGLAVGLEDLCRDLGVERTESGEETRWAQGAVVLAAKAAGISVSASVYSKVDDDAGLESYALGCRRMGFDGVGCIHPRQVPMVHRAFAPSEAEIARAQRICAAFDAVEGGVVLVDGAMVDLPVAERARGLLKRAGVVR